MSTDTNDTAFLLAKLMSRLPMPMLDQWDRLLYDLHQACGYGATTVVVAGGAIRDRLFNKPIADLDIFFDAPYAQSLGATLRKLNLPTSTPWEHANQEHDRAMEYEKWGVIDAMRTTLEDGTVLNVIQVKDTIERVHKFSVDISKVYYSINGLTLTREFIEAAAVHVATFRADASDEYKTKIRAKYSDWAFIQLPEPETWDGI